jgi:hypothetical protein
MVFLLRDGWHRHVVSHACAQSLPIHAMAHRSRTVTFITLLFSAVLHCALEPVEAASVCYRATIAADKISYRFEVFPASPGDISMVITAAHIQPIVALIAGVLILIMPRFLNLVVAIYLIFIGLAGLGLFKMLHT